LFNLPNVKIHVWRVKRRLEPSNTDGESELRYYPLAEVKEHCNKGLLPGHWVSNYVLWRPVSPYVSWVFVNLRLTAVFAVVLSIVFISVSVLMLFGNNPTWLVVAAIGIEIYNLLDHVDGELARFERGYLGRSSNRVAHYLDLFAHKISIISVFALGWAVADATGNDLYIILSFMLCFFMFGPANDPATQIVIDAAKKSDMTSAFAKLKALDVKKYGESDKFRPAKFLLFFNELFGFPGWLHLIVLACLLDAFVQPLGLMGREYLYREALIIGLTPIYVAKFLYSLRWYMKVMQSIRHND
jgi:hypothetical protein